jgi:hypothetical protein
LGEADEYDQLSSQHSPPKRAEDGGRMLKTWRGAAPVALAAGVALAVQLTAVVPAQAAGAAPTVTIAATSKLKVVTHDVFVIYHAGAYANATIHGTVTGGAGDVATLFAQQFPFKQAPVKAGSVALKAAKSSYSFTVTPTLYTKYTVRVINGANTVATSSVQSVYVSSLGAVSNSFSCASSGLCHDTLNVFVTVPSSTLSFELGKHVYPYFGINLNAKKTPPAPTWLYLNKADPSVKSHKVTADEYETTVHYTFSIGKDFATWLPSACQRDAVLKDGIGLPGSHGCGASRISTSQYYVG